MLIRREHLEGIASGKVSLAFRRWQKPSVKAGSTLRTAIGVLAIESMAECTEESITDRDARRAGYKSSEDLLKELRSGRPDILYRISLRLTGPDPRLELREQDRLTTEEATSISDKLARLDAFSRRGDWTARVLRQIAVQPAVPAGELAALLGLEKEWLKLQVRKLKELGLTESLQPGYRLSRRGIEFLKRSK